VVIISIDGLRPDAIDLAPMPVLQGLMQSGAYSLRAQTIDPSVTLPAHASMLTGLCPSVHGVDWDEYLPARGIAAGTDLFDLAHAAGLRTVLLFGKEKLSQVSEAASLDLSQWVNDPDVVIGKRAAAAIPQGFSVLFVHLADNDLEGHTYGWMSLQQLLALRSTDGALKTILDALEAASMRENTLIIVTADHGGHNTSHGFNIPSDMTIPWIVNGPGVVPAVLTRPINITDTAATAAWSLGLPVPAEWSGRPVWEAFGLPEAEPRPEPRCP
jgi:predicted AlkP superfamily pyrophosphatase or phosphodiesterase